ncbi:hypothetical protein A2803_04145 [Candidatus Woesebacteria bacterium RIFCSPHIGHO2_01_FULL_44_21]|uniref:Uncharacterized protein n=1 Tax=Candidatus Woesebacteria bacterium RIFCSPHIGHO2_01_FULL_44_21 TaxID=1802503 RepID=A0A1F7Z186_9BACT|nr:MAG: hypothetical protein A2803_04145 [Candidatus Woesebacteria bacterium RIFCSPHIGHO2_01_FULL_44_21]OGM71460.1 MAG: hypothetical protein A2897_04030 [Candidatus Woesebacteria bacterium RIFCSPLOWO2_01_FULL_44_24b]
MSAETPKLFSRRDFLATLGLGSIEAVGLWMINKDGIRESINKEHSILNWQERSGVFVAGEDMELEYAGKKYSVRVNELEFLETLTHIANEESGVDSLNTFLDKYPLHIVLDQAKTNHYASYVPSRLSDSPMLQFSKAMLGDYFEAGLTVDPQKLLNSHTAVMHELVHLWQDARGGILKDNGSILKLSYLTTSMTGGIIVGNNLSDKQDLRNIERSKATKISRRVFNTAALGLTSSFVGYNLWSFLTPDELEAYARAGQLALEPDNIQYINQFFKFEELDNSSL